MPNLYVIIDVACAAGQACLRRDRLEMAFQQAFNSMFDLKKVDNIDKVKLFYKMEKNYKHLFAEEKDSTPQVRIFDSLKSAEKAIGRPHISGFANLYIDDYKIILELEQTTNEVKVIYLRNWTVIQHKSNSFWGDTQSFDYSDPEKVEVINLNFNDIPSLQEALFSAFTLEFPTRRVLSLGNPPVETKSVAATPTSNSSATIAPSPSAPSAAPAGSIMAYNSSTTEDSKPSDGIQINYLVRMSTDTMFDVRARDAKLYSIASPIPVSINITVSRIGYVAPERNDGKYGKFFCGYQDQIDQTLITALKNEGVDLHYHSAQSSPGSLMQLFSIGSIAINRAFTSDQLIAIENVLNTQFSSPKQLGELVRKSNGNIVTFCTNLLNAQQVMASTPGTASTIGM